MVYTEQQIADMKNEFITLLRSTNRPGMDSLIQWLEEGSDFFSAPASCYYHNSTKGGLLNHSLNVYKAAKMLIEGAKQYAVPEKNINSITDDSVIICTLLHDLCKTNFYHPIEKFWKDDTRPVGSNWRKYMSYEIKDNFPVGHGEKSVIMIQNFIKLSAVEICAIRHHMGLSDPGAYLSPYLKSALMSAMNDIPLVALVAEADHFASFLMEKEVDQKHECEIPV